MGASSSKTKDNAASERARAIGKAEDASNDSNQRFWMTSTMLRKLPCVPSPKASTSSQEPSGGKETNCTCTLIKERTTSPTTSVDQKHINDDENTQLEPFSQDYEHQCLQKAGVYIARQIGSDALPDTGKHFCQKLSGFRYAIPEKPLYQGDNFFRVLETARTDNHTRLFRDLTPLIVPTPEHLFWTGLSSVDYLREKLFTGWDQVVPVADGPTICPDVAVGLHSHAFSNHELKQLDDYHAAVTPARFCEDLYFPFFTCDLSHGLFSSERKNARSAATAIHAILKLYAAGDCNLTSLSHEVLFFSVSHDAAFVEIFAHYPVTKNRKGVEIHCHLVRSFDLNDEDGKNRWTSYHYVRALYEHFSKIHLQRIKEAIIRLPNRGAEKTGSAASLSSADTAVDCEGHTTWRYLEAVLASIPRNLLTENDKITNSNKLASNEKKQRNVEEHEGTREWEIIGRLQGVLRDIEDLSHEREREQEQQKHEQETKDKSRLRSTLEQKSSKSADDSNRHCRNCVDCRGCRYSSNLTDCRDCRYSSNSTGCRSCLHIKNSTGCRNCRYTNNSTDCKDCKNCENATDSTGCKGCKNIVNCHDCSNISNASDLTGCHGMDDMDRSKCDM